MSVRTTFLNVVRARSVEADTNAVAGVFRPPAIGIVVLLVATLSVFYSVTGVVGGTVRLTIVLVVAIFAATITGRTVSLRAGLVLSGALLCLGFASYLLAIPASQRSLFTVNRVFTDTASLLTGFSVLRLTAARIWIISIAPVPTFLTWYLLVRGRDVLATAAAGSTLLFFVLTGDAGFLVTAVGVAGAAIAVSFRTAAGGLRAHWDTTATIVLAALVLSATVTVVPGGATQPLFADRDAVDSEANLVTSEEELAVVGSIELSPEVRFTVESEEAAYWRTASYDRYTGDGWVRTGESSAYDESLSGPPGETRELTQRIRAESTMTALPAAWRPERVSGVEDRTQVTETGDLQLGEPIGAGDEYVVVSQRPDADSDELQAAGTAYPAEVRSRYTQLPETTPDRVGAFTADLTEDDETPYEVAQTVETYLRTEREYSLSVTRPEGDIADAFLFEMDAGYCTYYATTMVTMLRTQGIPARFVTGYSQGQQVEDDTWVVRGQNAHAWVEVYFPGHGWIAFEPTPRDAYDDARDSRLSEARQSGSEGVDTEESAAAAAGTQPEFEDSTDEETAGSGSDDRANETDTNGSTDTNTTNGSVPSTAPSGQLDRGSVETVGDQFATPGTTGSGEGSDDDGIPTETYGLLGMGLLGAVIGARRLGYTERGYRLLWVRYQWGDRSPADDIERAVDRLETALALRYRPRRTGETMRTYLQSVRPDDDRVDHIRIAYERARYDAQIDRQAADAVVDNVDELVRELVSIRSLIGR
ncbi:transglutaminase family protein [Halalkalirubrum salinum]|uniref:transglutaminase family protein n=1 Tax=Halalkalirubrum salinum TaxID=2563889 RepID=UPI0010FB6E2E|nr:transglutaminaseTgpA domain-containing protein [Halalkalirubrum salinum]